MRFDVFCKFFWNILGETLFLHSFLTGGRLPDSIMVVRQILVLFVLVRIQVGQQVALSFAEGIFLAVSCPEIALHGKPYSIPHARVAIKVKQQTARLRPDTHFSYNIPEFGYMPVGAMIELWDMKKETKNKRIALVTGANQGVGLQVVKELVEAGHTVFLGSRDLAKGEAAAKEIGDGAIVLQIDVTDQASIIAAAAYISKEFGYLDLLVNNAAISNTRKGNLSLQEYAKISLASNISLEEVRTIWDTNVFGVLAVYQAMLPLLRESADARIVNVSSGVGSLTLNADPAYPYRTVFSPGYAASKTALNAITLAMMIEVENTNIKVNLVSPAFTSTNLNGFEGTESIADGSREVVRVALLGPDASSGTFTRWENAIIPW